MVDKYFPKQLMYNLKRSCGQINVGGAIVAKSYFNFGGNSHMTLEAAYNLV